MARPSRSARERGGDGGRVRDGRGGGRGAGGGDAATRERLLDAATRLFSERGFRGVTVRDLCRDAKANLAAVNYHFGDKLGLYREVVATALEDVQVDPTTDVSAGSTPEERIRHYVTTYVPRLASPRGRAVWAQKIMRHEMNDPTPLAPWIAEVVILPRMRFLAEAVAALMGTGTDDPRVGRCVVSLQAQCLSYMPNRFREVAFPGWREMTDADIHAAATHIADFTLAGIRRLAEEGG
jgi:AcrR family transcriptional regulator